MPGMGNKPWLPSFTEEDLLAGNGQENLRPEQKLPLAWAMLVGI